MTATQCVAVFFVKIFGKYYALLAYFVEINNIYYQGVFMTTYTDIDQRAVTLGQHILSTQDTIRKTAEIYQMAKSTVHYDVSHRLKEINYSLYLEVLTVLEKNFSEKHIRGGQSTREKYRTKKTSTFSNKC